MVLKVFYVFLLASLMVVSSVFLDYSFLGALGFPKYANISVVYGVIFHIIGLTLLLLFQSIRIYSVTYMVVYTEIMLFLMRAYWVKKEKLWVELS
jgi:PST family polysaccharide transporter